MYLRDGGRLETAASRDVAGPHAVVAARLLDLALGPFRARGIVASDDAAHDRRLASVRAAATEAGIEAAHAVPLVAHGDVIGLFAVYPPLGRKLDIRPVGPARGARRPDRGRGSERATARGDEAARRRARAGARRRARGGTAPLRPLRDLALLRAEPLPRQHPRRGRTDAGRAARGRCRGDPPSGRARRVARRAGRPRLEPAAPAGDPRDLRPARPGRRERGAAAARRGSAGPARPGLGRGARPLPPAARAVPRARLDRGRDSDRDALRAPRDAHARLARSAPAADRRDDRHGADGRRAGRPRGGQRQALPAAEGVHRFDAALAAAPHAPADGGARDRGDLRVVGACRRRGRHLRLPADRRRSAGDRARRRHRPRDRRCGRHGDGEVRLSLARAALPGAGSVSRRRERRRRRGDRSGQVHHDAVHDDRSRARRGRLRLRRSPAAAAARRERCRHQSRREGARPRNRAGHRVRASSGGRSSQALRPSSTPTASSRRAAPARCTARSGSTACLPPTTSYRPSSSPRSRSRSAAAGSGATSATTARSSSCGVRELAG